MACLDDGASLDMLIDLANQLDNLTPDRRLVRVAYAPRPPAMLLVEPMQLGHMRINPDECKQRRCEGRCYYCGAREHLLAQCPHRRSWQQGQTTTESQLTLDASSVSSSTIYSFPPFMLAVQIHYSDQCSVLTALIDYGSAENFLQQATKKLKIPQKL